MNRIFISLIICFVFISGCFQEDPENTVYSISGRITDNGTPLFGVTVTLSGVLSTSTTTSTSGHYIFENLPSGKYIITPISSGDNYFDPINIEVNLAQGCHDVNFQLYSPRLFFGSDSLIRAYDSSGNEVVEGWNKNYTDNRVVNGTAYAADSNIYVIFGGQPRGFICRYSREGDEETVINNMDISTGLESLYVDIVDSETRIYVATVIPDASGRFLYDGGLKKYVNGVEDLVNWNKRFAYYLYDDTGSILYSGHDNAISVSVDSKHNVHLAGYINLGSYNDSAGLLLEFTPEGKLVWPDNLELDSPYENYLVWPDVDPEPVNPKMIFIKSVIDSKDNLYIAGAEILPRDPDEVYETLSGVLNTGLTNGIVKKYNSSGEEIWTRIFPEVSIVTVELDSQDNIFVANLDFGSVKKKPFILKKFNSDGIEFYEQDGWDKKISDVNITDLTIDRITGDVYAAGNGLCILKKFDRNGNELWSIDELRYQRAWVELFY